MKMEQDQKIVTTPAPSTPDAEYVRKAFTYHAPDDRAKEAHSVMRECSRYIALQVMRWVPEGRERSLALTKIEEAMMWANAGIARNGARELK